MGKSNTSDPTLIIIQFENFSFNAGIILNETNYNMWSQIMEIPLLKKRNSCLSVEVRYHLLKRMKDMLSGTQTIKGEEVHINIFVELKTFVAFTLL